MTDYELRHTQYRHPEQTSGQHTNGPLNIFVRQPGGPWYWVRLWPLSQVRRMIAEMGLDEFVKTHGEEVGR